MTCLDTPLCRKPDLPFPLVRSERDRDIFDLGGSWLIVASDRISTDACTLADGIPDKGRILTQIARFWFGVSRDIVPNHLLSEAPGGLPEALEPFQEILDGRSVLARKVAPFPVLCTVRGYLAGSALEEYRSKGSVCGIVLPPRLKAAARLTEPLFTPAVRTVDGGRRNIPMAEMMDLIGAKASLRLKARSLALYMLGYHLAWKRDIILADAGFRFGQSENGRLVLTDEALTPDTSRYWVADRWRPGQAPSTLDRRCLLEYLADRTGWDGTPPAPRLPRDIVEDIRNGYLDLARRFGVVA